jgi:hypothetical protein
VERDPLNGPDAPPRRRRWIILVIAVLAVAAGGAAVWWVTASDDGGTRSARTLFTPEERAPEGVRIRVEILNATATPRLAQSATRLLRDRGFDVVSIGNNPTRRDSTLVLDRTNHPEWARLVASVLGRSSAVAARPDSSRYVDITVLLGADWTPPSKAFDP